MQINSKLFPCKILFWVIGTHSTTWVIFSFLYNSVDSFDNFDILSVWGEFYPFSHAVHMEDVLFWYSYNLTENSCTSTAAISSSYYSKCMNNQQATSSAGLGIIQSHSCSANAQ